MGIRGQKVNPIGWRLGVHRKWKDNWIQKNNLNTRFLISNLYFKKYLEASLYTKKTRFLVLNNHNFMDKFKNTFSFIFFYKYLNSNYIKKRLNSSNISKRNTYKRHLLFYKKFRKSLFLENFTNNIYPKNLNIPFDIVLDNQKININFYNIFYNINFKQKYYNEKYFNFFFIWLTRKNLFNQILINKINWISKYFVNKLTFINKIIFKHLVIQTNNFLTKKDLLLYNYNNENKFNNNFKRLFKQNNKIKLNFNRENKIKSLKRKNIRLLKTLKKFTSERKLLISILFLESFLKNDKDISLKNQKSIRLIKEIKNNIFFNLVFKKNYFNSININGGLKPLLYFHKRRLNLSRKKKNFIKKKLIFSNSFKSKFFANKKNKLTSYYLSYYLNLLFWLIKRNISKEHLFFESLIKTSLSNYNKNNNVSKYQPYKKLIVQMKLFENLKYLKLKFNIFLNTNFNMIFMNFISFYSARDSFYNYNNKLNDNLLINKQSNFLTSQLLQPFRENDFIKNFTKLLVKKYPSMDLDKSFKLIFFFLFLKDAKSLSKLIALKISSLKRNYRQTTFIRNFLGLILRFINSFNDIKGIRIQVKGRFNKWSRTKSIIMEVGSFIKTQVFDYKLEFGSCKGVNKKGAFGVRVWLMYDKKFNLNYKKHFLNYWNYSKNIFLII